jgi:hypothetical protein
MKGNLLLGIVLIVLGVATLLYGQFSYRTRETVVKLGPIEATAEKTKSVPLPPILGWGLVVAGAGVLVFASKSKP